VRQNLAWALAYNVVALPLAVAGLVTPWMAGIGMASSSLLVVLNALRLVRDREAGGWKRKVLTPVPGAAESSAGPVGT
jgi:Cu2+-exporting ATPase